MPKRHVAGRGTRWWWAHHVPSAEAGISSKRKCGVTCTNDGMEEGIQVTSTSTYVQLCSTVVFNASVERPMPRAWLAGDMNSGISRTRGHQKGHDERDIWAFERSAW